MRDHETDDIVRRLRGEGLAFSAIAERLGTTRGAVAGRCQRLGLCRPVTESLDGPRTVIRTAPKPRPAAVKPKPVPVEPSKPDASSNVTFLNAKGCRYTLWSADEQNLDRKLVCGAAVERGAYCAYHAHIAYRSPESRRAA